MNLAEWSVVRWWETEGLTVSHTREQPAQVAKRKIRMDVFET